MNLPELDKILRERAEHLSATLRLLSQLPLLDQEYEASISSFRAWMNGLDTAETAARKYPLAFGRLLSELTARCYIPRKTINQQGYGLWENLHQQLPNTIPGNAIGRLFRQAVYNLRRCWPFLFWQELKGWRFVGPLLIHAGLPVQAIPIVLEALRPWLTLEPRYIARMSGSDIEERLQSVSGLNKYTREVLTNTEEGVLLIRQFMQLARLVAGEGIATNAENLGFSGLFLQALHSALSEGLDRQHMPTRATCEPRLIWDPEIPFIGWLVPTDDHWTQSANWNFVGDITGQQAATCTSTAGMYYVAVGPDQFTLDLVATTTDTNAKRFHSLADHLYNLILFDRQTGRLLPWPQLIKEGLPAGDYLALCRRRLELEQIIQPGDVGTVTEVSVPMPGIWRRRYRGICLEINSNVGAEVAVQISDRRKVVVRIQGAEQAPKGNIVLDGGQPSYLRALHLAVLGEKLPVFVGPEPPDIICWGGMYSNSPPVIRLLHWQNNSWMPLRCVRSEVTRGTHSTRVSLTGGELAHFQTSVLPGLFRLELTDLSLDAQALSPIHYLWLPRTRYEVPAGLVLDGSPARMAIALPWHCSTGSATGRLIVRHLGGGTQIIHSLPAGLRSGRLTLEFALSTGLGSIALEWNAHGVATACLGNSAHPIEQAPQYGTLPIATVDIADRTTWQGQRIAIRWWPALFAPVIAYTSAGLSAATLTNLAFDGNGVAVLALSDLLDVTSRMVVEHGEANVSLRTPSGLLPIVKFISQVRVDELRGGQTGRDNGDERPDDSVELLRLLWMCELSMAHVGENMVHYYLERLARLQSQLVRRASENPTARHMEARLTRWLHSVARV